MEARRNYRRTFVCLANLVLAILLMAGREEVLANEGDPIAIRYWPGGCSSIETMWNLHVAFGVDVESRAAMPRAADVEFVDDFWSASGTENLVLDRKPNEIKAVLKPASECPDPSRNAISFKRVVLTNPKTNRSISVNVLVVDGVTIVDSNKNSVQDLIDILSEVKELPDELGTIDAFLVDDAIADRASYETLAGIINTRVMVLRSPVKFDMVVNTPIDKIAHNTLVISKSVSSGKTRWVKLAEVPWVMSPVLAELFQKKETVSKSSRAVFAELSVNQLNFRPSNGTHTPRWNAEHMMGRELLFFSQIYHAVDSSIPIMDLNPKQMPPDYRPAHADWTGLEESMQMERVECFTRRFAHLFDGMDLNKTAKGSAFWTPRALLRQMEAHYREHTANVVKKTELPDWPEK